MALVEPIPDAPAATADLGDESALVIADYHAGVERALRREGVEVRSRADARRKRTLALVERTDPDRVVFLGDLGHHIGEPKGAERNELVALLDALPVPATLVKGNHDGMIDEVVDVEVTAGTGVRLGDVGFTHGHTWPSKEVLAAETVCVGHEHPAVRLEDEVGGSRVERAWLRGSLEAEPFEAYSGEEIDVGEDLVVFPAFNELVGGTWVNVPGQGFLAPFLPDASPGAEVFLLDGTRLGPFRTV